MFLFLSVLFLAPYTESCVRVTTDAPASSTPSTPAESCTSCDIDKIAPIITDPEVSFSFLDTYNSNGCKVTRVTCQRTSVCETAKLRATGSTGTRDVSSLLNSDSASANIFCAPDGTHEIFGFTMITQLYCEFGGMCV